MQRVETTAGAVGFWASLITMLTTFMGWITANATLCGLLIAAAGLGIQWVSSRRNESRKEEEHQLRMALLRKQIDDSVSQED